MIQAAVRLLVILFVVDLIRINYLIPQNHKKEEEKENTSVKDYPRKSKQHNVNYKEANSKMIIKDESGNPIDIKYDDGNIASKSNKIQDLQDLDINSFSGLKNHLIEIQYCSS